MPENDCSRLFSRCMPSVSLKSCLGLKSQTRIAKDDEPILRYFFANFY